MNALTEPSLAVHLVAHRGYAYRYPENTREAIAAAVAAGASYIEFDVQLSADQVPFLMHDKDFMRTAGVDECIFDMNAARLAGINVGEAHRFGGTYTEVRLPRLNDIVADLGRWEDVTAFVELKVESIEQFGLIAVLDAVLPVLEPVIGRCVVISFDPGVVREARHRSNCRIGWVLPGVTADAHAVANALLPEFLFCDVQHLPQLPGSLWHGAWEWAIYEITDPEQAVAVAARGVRYIETMAYTELAGGLAQRVTV